MGQPISCHFIGRIMKQEDLVLNYTAAQFKLYKAECNEDKIENVVNRQFDHQEYLNVVASDLIYVRVEIHWRYLFVLIDLFNCEIIDYISGSNKDASLVKKVFIKVKTNLNQIKLFHTDSGNEFKNKVIDKILNVFEIDQSLSMQECPYDNVIEEATYKVIKIEFVNNQIFETHEQL